MKNIHVLPTDKPSRLQLFEGINEFELCSKDSFFNKGVHIYITSDEEIKEGDYYISILENEVYKATKETENIMSVANLIRTTTYKNTHFKIILTTDQDLIKDGVQAIDYEFLEWFVKNPSCEKVDIMTDTFTVKEMSMLPIGTRNLKYKTIIPKEEPKQETLDEVALKLYPLSAIPRKIWLRGAKWQQQQNKNLYSEEEVLQILTKFSKFGDVINQEKYLKQWFKQFKKQ